MVYDVIIIGAGASGLMAAITAARGGSSVLVLERKEKAGKKILATGNGKCNFTNLVQKPECYRSNDSAFAMKVLSCFDVQKTLLFFEELGIYPKERDGYYYPNSEQAASVQQVLLMECERLGVRIQCNEQVKEILQPDYTIITEASDHKKIRYQGNKLILAAGGCASPQLGSDGSGYQLAKALGHTIIQPLPALVQLKSPNKCCKTVSGVRTIAKVTAIADGKQLSEEVGEVIFTDYGISGIPVLQVSRFIAKELAEGRKTLLNLDFLKDISEEELMAILKKRISHNPGLTYEEMLIGLLNHKLNYILIKEAGSDPTIPISRVSEKELGALIRQMKEFKLPINATNSFEQAQVCAGGVSTEQINPDKMESLLHKGLYFAGELVDVDGTCGGYNLQWAWSSGYVAGISAGTKK